MTFHAETIASDHRDIRLKAHVSELSEIIQELLENREGYLGRGKAAEVHFSAINRGVCYKIITEPLRNKEYNNDVRKETRITDMLHDIEAEGVRTPKVYFSFIGYDDETGREIHAIAMETIEGVTIRELVEGKGQVPDGFSVSKFTGALKAYAAEMHGRGIYHRDLHEGNVMLAADGSARIIDFGDACLSVSDTDREDPYTDIPIGNKPTVHYTDDITNIGHIQTTLQRFIDKKP